MADTVIVAVSGGVDSAVAAWLLKQQGHVVQGLFMSNWDEQDSYCTIAQDYQDARRICDVLDIPLHRASFAPEYRQQVFSHFLREYRAGRTPNPDVLCNREIKFGSCLAYMLRLGANRMATGHYARVLERPDGVLLARACDDSKDQSYFLHAVARDALKRTLFPIGHLQKSEVRRIAWQQGLPVFDKPDSTGICFIGERPFQEFLMRYVDREPGPIETPSGVILGEHQGLPFYTLGQRSGLHLGGKRGAAAAPWYVASKDAGRNALIVVQDPQHPLLLSDEIMVQSAHWFRSPPAQFACSVKTRYRQPDVACEVSIIEDSSLRVRLGHPVRAVTPGQFAVFYDGDCCLGGGTIVDRALHAPIAYNHGLSSEVS